jgi:nucleotide-binding universal stress UspA family protein
MAAGSHAACSTRAVRAAAARFLAVGTIVAAFDGSDASERALRRASELAGRLEAQLAVVSVATPPVPTSGIETAVPGASAHLAADATDELEAARVRLDRARELLGEVGADAELVEEVGSPADAIVRAAEEWDAEVIVVGASTHSFLERLLEGDVGADVARHTRRDVLIVH